MMQGDAANGAPACNYSSWVVAARDVCRIGCDYCWGGAECRHLRNLFAVVTWLAPETGVPAIWC